MKEILLAFKKSFTITWSFASKNLIVMVIIKLLVSISPIMTIYLFQNLINEASKLVSGDGDINYVIYLLISQVSILIFISGIQFINQINEKRMQDHVSIHIKSEVFKKINNIPYIKLETPEFFNKVELVKNSDGKIVEIIKSGFSLISEIITLCTILAYLFLIHWALVLIFFIVMIPLFIVQIKLGKQRYQLVMEQAMDSRKEYYFSELLTSRESVKELKLFNISSFIINKWRYIFQNMSERYISLLKKQLLYQLGITALLVITHALTSAFVVYLIYVKGLMIGILVGVIQSIQTVQSSINVITQNFSNLYESSLYVKELNLFMTIENEERLEYFDDPFKIQDIQINNLSFVYPKQNKKTISNINLSIHPGKKIAIVGENGSGKTTLIKCLTGLYKTENSIFINGNPLNKNNLGLYQNKISVLFQDYLKYAFTIKENIGLGNLKDIENLTKIKNTAKITKIDSFVSTFPETYNTILGRLFEEGHELSGGQWQKIAITRSMFRDSDLIILDEPTSALDPKSESDIIDQLFHIAQEKSIIVITHRLGVARLADEIIVMKDGEIYERGTHSELMVQQGEYSRLYNLQSKWFDESLPINV